MTVQGTATAQPADRAGPGTTGGGSAAATTRVRRTTALDVVVAVAAALGAITIGVGGPSGPLVLVVLLAWFVAPGWALTRWIRTACAPAALVAFTVGAGAAVLAGTATLMLFADAWQPTAALVVILSAAAVSALVPAPVHPAGSWSERVQALLPRTERRRTVLFLAVAAACLCVGLLPLRPVRVLELGQWGLLPLVQGWWYLALACLVGTAAVSMIGRGRQWATGVVVLATVLLLSATPTLMEHGPRYTYAYKHVAVMELLGSTGRLHPGVDIYNHWPAFFAYAALFEKALGSPNPLGYLGWTEVVFTLFDALVVYAIARALRLPQRWAWLAALVFSLGNWVGQNYYSPQAFAFTLYLVLALAVIGGLPAVPRRLLGLLARVARRRPTWAAALQARDVSTVAVDGAARRGVRPVVVALGVIGLQAVIVTTHQLTPYMLALGFLPLFLAGFFRFRWLGLVLLAMSLLYLLPNFAFVEEHYGVLEGFDLVSNATSRLGAAGSPTPANRLQSGVVILFSLALIVLGGLGSLLHLRGGGAQRALLVLWLSVAPGMVLLGQSYGGEGRLRVVLFGVPWWSIGVAWLLARLRPARPRSIALLAACTACLTAAFTFAWLQPEAENAVTASDVRAGRWIDANAHRGDVVIGEIPRYPSLPLLVGRGYPNVLERQYEQRYLEDALVRPTLHGRLALLRARLDSLPAGTRVFVVFSPHQEAIADLHRVPGYRQLGRFEAALLRSPTTTTVYAVAGTRIHRIL